MLNLTPIQAEYLAKVDTASEIREQIQAHTANLDGRIQEIVDQNPELASSTIISKLRSIISNLGTSSNEFSHLARVDDFREGVSQKDVDGLEDEITEALENLKDSDEEIQRLFKELPKVFPEQ